MSSPLLPPNRSKPPGQSLQQSRQVRATLPHPRKILPDWTVEFKNWKKQLNFLDQRLTNNIKLRSKPPRSIMRDFLASC